MLKRVITWSIVIALGFYLLTQPHGAQNVAAAFVGLLKSGSSSLANFVQSL